MEMEERHILNAETKLQDDAIAFEEFLRENDQRSVEALKVFVLFPLAESLSTSRFLFFSSSEHSTGQHKLTNLLLFSAAQETVNKLHMTAELKKALLDVQAVKR